MTARFEATETVRELHNDGLKDWQIAERLGISARTVLRIRTALGLSKPNPLSTWRATQEWKDRVQALLDDDWSISEISRETGNTHPTIKRHFPNAGWDPVKAGSYALSIAKANRELRRRGIAPLPATPHAH